MKLTYVEAADIWVISKIKPKDQKAVKEITYQLRSKGNKCLITTKRFHIKKRSKQMQMEAIKLPEGNRVALPERPSRKSATPPDRPNKQEYQSISDVADDLQTIAKALRIGVDSSSNYLKIPRPRLKSGSIKLAKALQSLGISSYSTAEGSELTPSYFLNIELLKEESK